jgi:hypothetical protein
MSYVFGLVLHAIVVGIWSNSQTHPPSKGFKKNLKKLK